MNRNLMTLLRLRILSRRWSQIYADNTSTLLADNAGAQRRCYAVASKALPEKEDKSFVDLDAEKLCSHVCINYFIEGEEPGPKILPNDQYPPWLFELDLRGKRELEDMDPEVDGWEYWKAVKKRQVLQARRFEKLKLRFLHLQNSPSMRKSGGLSNKPPSIE